MSSPSKDRDWAGYYAKTSDRPPRETLMFALDRFDAAPSAGSRFAVDLGAGGGRDGIEMLRRGWRVLAIDAETAAIDAFKARADLPPDARLSGKVARFEDATWPDCDLVNSSFALPMCAPEAFTRVWKQIVSSLKPDGRFAGHLFGDRDSWAGNEGMTFHSRTDVDALLAGFEVEYFNEEEEDSTTVRGETKHWHVFHIVARRAAA